MSTFLRVADAPAWRMAARVGEALLAGAIVYPIMADNWSAVWQLGLGLYDQIVHGFTSFAVTLSFGFLLFRAEFDAFQKHRWLFILTITSFGLALGGFWEIVEWVSDQTFGTALAPNETDTAIDLIGDSLGAFGAALLANWGLPERAKPKRRS